MKGLGGPALISAVLAALLWMGIGTFQRMQAGAELSDALVAELPLNAVIFVVALVLATRRRR